MSDSPPISRRAFISASTLIATAAACGSTPTSPKPDNEGGPRVHLAMRSPSRTTALGEQRIGLPNVLQRDGVLYVPSTYRVNEPLPLVVLLHGATGSGTSWFGSYAQRAEDARVIMLAPDSRSLYTWDVIENYLFGPDVAFLEKAIDAAFDRCAIDRTRMALVGFSDGASYATTLGLANGDLFPQVVAFSPATSFTPVRHGHPRFRIMHGTSDSILPIDLTSRRLVPALREEGYDVTYTEFDGDHEVPSANSDAAMAWLVSGFEAVHTRAS